MPSIQISTLKLEETGNNKIEYVGSNTLVISTAGSEKLRVNETQIINVGANLYVQTVSSSANLDVTGTINANQYFKGTTSPFSGLIAIKHLTTGTQYTTPSNCTKIYVECVGGGGGGVTSGNDYGSAGSGAYCAKLFNVSPNTTYNFQIGSGGAAGGGSGGSTTFTVAGVTITAGGGSGAVVGNIVAFGGGGYASGGDLNARGSGGTSLITEPAAGAPSFFGGGGVGNTGEKSDLGGGGGSTYSSGASGAGGDGVIRIMEFY